jgi:hypothetical protein
MEVFGMDLVSGCTNVGDGAAGGLDDGLVWIDWKVF